MLEQTKPACVWNTFSKFLSTKIMSNCKLLISNNTIKIKSNLLFGLYEREFGKENEICRRILTPGDIRFS